MKNIKILESNLIRILEFKIMKYIVLYTSIRRRLDEIIDYLLKKISLVLFC